MGSSFDDNGNSTIRALGLGNALTLEHPKVIIDETLDVIEDD